MRGRWIVVVALTLSFIGCDRGSDEPAVRPAPSTVSDSAGEEQPPAGSSNPRPLDVPGSDTVVPDTSAPEPLGEDACSRAAIERGLPYPGLARSDMIVRISCSDGWATVLSQPPTDAPGFVLLLARTDNGWVHDRTCDHDVPGIIECLADLPDDIVEDLALVGETYPLGEDGGEPDSWAAECSSPPLRRGDSGLCVARLQTLLVGTFGAAIVIDGQFGLATEDSVIAFQTSWGLVADGQAGPATWVALADAAS